jgi:hypothetical protein
MSVKTALAALSVFRDKLYKHHDSYADDYFVTAEKMGNNCEFFLQRNLVSEMTSFLQKELGGRDGDEISGFLDEWWDIIGFQGTCMVMGIAKRCWEDFERNLQEE